MSEAAPRRCPRPRCGAALEPWQFCCADCLRLVPASILHDVLTCAGEMRARAEAAAVDALAATRVCDSGRSLAIRRGRGAAVRGRPPKAG